MLEKKVVLSAIFKGNDTCFLCRKKRKGGKSFTRGEKNGVPGLSRNQEGKRGGKKAVFSFHSWEKACSRRQKSLVRRKERNRKRYSYFAYETRGKGIFPFRGGGKLDWMVEARRGTLWSHKKNRLSCNRDVITFTLRKNAITQSPPRKRGNTDFRKGGEKGGHSLSTIGPRRLEPGKKKGR